MLKFRKVNFKAKYRFGRIKSYAVSCSNTVFISTYETLNIFF